MVSSYHSFRYSTSACITNYLVGISLLCVSVCLSVCVSIALCLPVCVSDRSTAVAVRRTMTGWLAAGSRRPLTTRQKSYLTAAARLSCSAVEHASMLTIFSLM